MNNNRGRNLSARKKIFVSGILTAMLVFCGLVILLPMSSDVAVGYIMPGDVDWDMDDLVSNSSGAVTSGTPDLYYVHDDIDISSNSTLNVSPGQTIYFDSGTGFYVHGNLWVTGTNVSSITLTSNEPDPSYGDWDGLYFLNGSGGSILYTSISWAENGVMCNDTMLSGITYSDFTSNVWGVQIINGYCVISGSTFTDNGILPHPDPLYSVGGGIYMSEGSWGSVSHNDFISNIGGVRVGKALYLYLLNNYFFNNSVYGIYVEGGDYWNQTYMQINYNEIHSNPNYGIYADLGFDSFIDTNNITGNRVGIHVEGRVGGSTSGGGIYNNWIAHNFENGIECYGFIADPGGDLTPRIYGNDIISNDYNGIYCENSNPNIDTNDILGNQFGVYSHISTPRIYKCYFNDNDFAVRANASEIEVIDSEIVSSDPLDFLLSYDSYVTTLNTTFNHEDVYFSDDPSTLEVNWYLHILVINGSGPVPGADVTVSDNENGTWTQDYKTDSTGRVKWIVVTEYIRNRTDWVFYTPHNITASQDSEVGYAEPFMDMSKFVVIDLGPGIPPPKKPLPPVDLEIALVGSNLEEIELSWGASGDDGAGADDVVEYIIYRAESVNGPYSEAGSVPADDSPTYSWIDSGLGDGEWNNYFYIVKAKDSDGLEDDNNNKVGKFVSSLDSGWNMISVPLVQSDTSRETVLQTLGNNYATVQGYHAGKSRPWLHWHRWKPNYFNDVIEIDHTRGYYIDMIVADHLVTVGKVASEVQISLKSGWNLVGNPCLTAQLRDDALSSISGQYNMVERFDTTKDKEVRLTGSDYMDPGDGFWIHATETCTWVVTN
ncbi:MAG: right-handed parallel beta-helix repeat-containing protein [Thermoplasmata archaeon]|nr:MAG: right-handed parallel beta-helix repeat-containing protein [Thermoplasmata archaeon]